MRRFNFQERPDLKFKQVKRKVKTELAIQMDEPFELGTANGIAHGKTGDYLVMSENSLSRMTEKDFEVMYGLVRKKAVKKEEPKVEEKKVEEKKTEAPKAKAKPKAKKKAPAKKKKVVKKKKTKK